MSSNAAASSSTLNTFVNTVAKRISDVIGTQAKTSANASKDVKEMMKEIVSSAETLNKAGPILKELTKQLKEADGKKEVLAGRLRDLEAGKAQAEASVLTLKNELMAKETQANADATAAAEAETKAKEEAAAQKAAADKEAALQREAILNAIRTQIAEAEKAVDAAKTEADLVSTQVSTLDGEIKELTSKSEVANKTITDAEAAKKDLDERLKAAAQMANAQATILAKQTAVGAEKKLANSVGLLNPSNVNQLNTKLQGLQPTVNDAFKMMKEDGLAALKGANQKVLDTLGTAETAVRAATDASGTTVQGGRRKRRTLRKRNRKFQSRR